MKHRTAAMVDSKEAAEALLRAVFDAWNARDIPLMLTHFCDDLVFVEHAGRDGAHYKVRHGAQTFGDYLQTYLDVADCESKLKFLAYDGIYIRTVVAFTLFHRKRGQRFDGSFRQVIRLRDDLISHLDEYHDVGTSTSFWDLDDD